MQWLWDLYALCTFPTPPFLHEHHLFSIFGSSGITTVAATNLEQTVNDKSCFCIWGVWPTIRPRYVRFHAACIQAQSYSRSRLYIKQIPSVDEGISSRGITKLGMTLFVISITSGESFQGKSRRGRAHLASLCSCHVPWGGAREAAHRPRQGQKGERSVPCSKSLPSGLLEIMTTTDIVLKSLKTQEFQVTSVSPSAPSCALEDRHKEASQPLPGLQAKRPALVTAPVYTKQLVLKAVLKCEYSTPQLGNKILAVRMWDWKWG